MNPDMGLLGAVDFRVGDVIDLNKDGGDGAISPSDICEMEWLSYDFFSLIFLAEG
jgi:hypothetical protein